MTNRQVVYTEWTGVLDKGLIHSPEGLNQSSKSFHHVVQNDV